MKNLPGRRSINRIKMPAHKTSEGYHATLFFLLPVLAMAVLGCSAPKTKKTAARNVKLSGPVLHLAWEKGPGGWQLRRVQALKDGAWTEAGVPSGEYTLLYSPAKPDSTPVRIPTDAREAKPGELPFRQTRPGWVQATTPVSMNVAGEAFHFFPATAGTTADGGLRFTRETAVATVQATWKPDARYPADVVVEMTLTAKKDGYFSLASPTLATLPEKDLAWGILPGYFQGKALQDNFILAYAYGQGIPDKPVVVRERTATTLAPLLSAANGVTLAVIPNPGLSRDPWEKDQNTHRQVWQVGLSLMDRKARLSPTMYYPVLGEKGSRLAAGGQMTYGFRYALQAADWFTVYKHAIYDIYRFTDFLALKQTRQSLSDRLLAMHRYVADDTTSMWRVEEFEGLKIGAQSYLGNVIGARDKDAIKNSDYGAMWMLARISGDSVLRRTRLPYARNFKLKQQEDKPGFFQGAAVGQYYLQNSRRFTEEWGSHVEPISLTYYTMLDMGNILLFEPGDAELRARLRLGADRLLAWQKPAGNWEVAYDRETQALVYPDLTDLRPTFYGLLVAYRVLGDQKYLEAARRGADWFVEHAVAKAHFLGVCGDSRLINDFATAQSAQVLLTFTTLTKKPATATPPLKLPACTRLPFTPTPIPSVWIEAVQGTARQDWQISQVGLSFEHGGSVGSAGGNGPILPAMPVCFCASAD